MRIYTEDIVQVPEIFCKENNTWVSEEVRNIGKLEEIRVVKRTSGGAISEIVLKGTDAEILVKTSLISDIYYVREIIRLHY